MTRYAKVRISGSTTVRMVNAYLPENYDVVATIGDEALIAGYDRAGWTLDGYVIPRLASGLIFATEIGENDSLVNDAIAEIHGFGSEGTCPACGGTRKLGLGDALTCPACADE